MDSNDGVGAYSAGLALTIAIAVGLVAGFVDVIVTAFHRPESFSAFSGLLAPAATTAVLIFFAWTSLWFVIGHPLARRQRLDAGCLAASFSLFLITIFTLGDINRFADSARDPFLLVIILIISVLVLVASYHFARTMTIKGAGAGLASLGVSVPFLLVLTVFYQWIRLYKLDASSSVVAALVAVGYFLAVIVLASPFAAGALSSHRDQGQGGKRPVKHVILIVIDTLRPDYLSCYNPDALETPHIDRFADDALLFSKAISPAPWTLPSVASLLTGLPCSTHETLRREDRLPDVLPTFAERMRDAGYLTGAIGSNEVIKHKPRNMFQGFTLDDFYPKETIDGSLGTGILKRVFPRRYKGEVTTEEIADISMKWVESHQNSDFFLYIHFFDPHGPYEPPAGYMMGTRRVGRIGLKYGRNREVRLGTFTPTAEERGWIQELYGGEVRYVDDNVGRYVGRLKELGIYDDALIILTSDHGEEFWEHGSVGHGQSLYQEQIWVPLIVKLPGSAKTGRIDTAVPTQSIMPTVLDLCEVDFDREQLTVGSIAPLWQGNPAAFGEQAIYSAGTAFFEPREAIVFGGAKYIRSLMRDFHELYDLGADPREQSSIADSSPGTVETGRAFLREHGALSVEVRDHYGIRREAIELDAETLKRLKALGYM
jgi:arylsulfatase A-like enzyme